MVINKETAKCISISEKPGNFGIEFHNKGYKLIGINQVYIPLKVEKKKREMMGLLHREINKFIYLTFPIKGNGKV